MGLRKDGGGDDITVIIKAEELRGNWQQHHIAVDKSMQGTVLSFFLFPFPFPFPFPFLFPFLFLFLHPHLSIHL